MVSSEFKIDRRKLIKLGFSAGVLATLPSVRMVFADDVSDALLQFVSESESPLDSARTGSLSQSEFDSLFSLCEYVDTTWEFGANMPQYRQQLHADLDLKTTRQPSYLAEYKSSLELVDLVIENAGSAAQAWPTLLFSEAGAENFSATKLGRARRFVFSEIIGHQIPISGAFKGFGLVNYRGYFGGPYALPASYRRAVL